MNIVNRNIVVGIHHELIDHVKGCKYQPKESITGICLSLITAALTGELKEYEFAELLKIELAMYKNALEIKYGNLFDQELIINSIAEIIESINPRYYIK